MADITVLERNTNTWRVVLHFPVPGGNNAVGTLWSDALVRSGLGGVTILLEGDGTGGTIGTIEKSAIEAGTVFEQVVNIDIDGSGATNATRRAMLRAEWAIRLSELTDHLSTKLNFFGHNETSV